MTALANRLRHLRLVPERDRRVSLDDIELGIALMSECTPEEVGAVILDALRSYHVPEGAYRREWIVASLQAYLRSGVVKRVGVYT